MNKTDKAVNTPRFALIRWTYSDHTTLQNVHIEGRDNPNGFETIPPCNVGDKVSMNARPSGEVLLITDTESDIYRFSKE